MGSLVELFQANIFQRLLSNNRGEKFDHLENEVTNESEEVQISLIGPFLWSPEYFVSSLSRSSSFDDSASGDDSEVQSKRNVDASEPEKTKGFDSQPFSSNLDDLHSNKREKRKLATTRMTANEVSQELSKANVNPHMLIAPHVYRESFGAGASVSQPFKITVHPQVGFLCDLHGHLCEAEVIGLLAGRWDAEAKILYVQAAFPCTSTERREDDGSTDVELDPVAELAVREIISSLGLIVVGWYHSHPQFRPDPSVTDIHNQQQYQTLMRDEVSGLEPFIGLIVSTFDEKLPSVESHHQWFHTRPYADGARGKKPVSIPMLLDVDIGVYVEPHQGVEAFLSDEATEDLIQRLCYLSIPSTIDGTSETGDSDARNGMGMPVRVMEPPQWRHEPDDHSMDSEGETGEYDMSRSVSKNQLSNSYSIPMHFAGSGGPTHLDDLLVPITAVKRKYTKRTVEPVIVGANERRSGRETKAPKIFVPEKDEKIKIPSAAAEKALPPPPPPVPPTASPVIAKSTGKIRRKPGPAKGALSSAKRRLESQVQVQYDAPKEQGGVFVGAIGKWLSAGAVLVKPAVLQAVPTKRGKYAVKAEVVVKEAVKAVTTEKKRQGPGARGFKSLYSVPKSHTLPQPIVQEEPRSSSGSNASVAKRKRNLKAPGKAAKRQNMKDIAPVVQYSGGETKIDRSKAGAKSRKEDTLKPRKKIKKELDSVTDLGYEESNTYGVGDGDGEVEKEVVSVTLLELLQGPSGAAAMGRRLVCCMKPAYRCLVLGTATLGFYYSTYSRRVSLGSVWKDGILKSDKLKGSITYWASRLGINSSSQSSLVDSIVSFLLVSWSEGEGQIHIEPVIALKKKRTTAHDSHICSSHVNADGKLVIYREDDGRDDGPKKKKKKKALKNKKSEPSPL